MICSFLCVIIHQPFDWIIFMCALSCMEHKTLCRTSIIVDAANAGVRVPICLRTFRAVLLMNQWRMDDNDDHDH